LDYNLIAHRPAIDAVCDVCSGALSTRSDDNPEALAVRLAAYHGETRPVIEIFQRKEYVATIDASLAVADVYQEIRTKFSIG
jgi:adenylate kinase